MGRKGEQRKCKGRIKGVWKGKGAKEIKKIEKIKKGEKGINGRKRM